MEKPEHGIGHLLESVSITALGGGPTDEKELAAKAFLKAIKKDSPRALVEAFGELLDSFDCEYVDDDSNGEDKDEEKPEEAEDEEAY